MDQSDNSQKGVSLWYRHCCTRRPQIIATGDGIFVEATFDKENKKGNYVVIKHNNTFTTFYSHMKSISVKAGDKVTKGQVIGYLWNTGTSTVRTSLRVIKNGQRVNPAEYMKE
jgi:murein DD-endopeptidase MepM/ murein hydrolase activator NlpD